MARKRSAVVAGERARDTHRLKAAYPDLYAAMSAWLDRGDIGPVEGVLNTMERDDELRGYPSISDDMTRPGKINTLASRFATASQLVARCRRLLDGAIAQQDVVRAELIATIAVPDTIAGYQKEFMMRLEAEGIRQPELHTGGRGLASAVAAFIKQYDAERHGATEQRAPDSYADMAPLSSWSELPRQFAGIELVDVAPGDEAGFETTPLPPFTDIAAFAEDGSRPSLGETRRDTVSGWSRIIEAWCNRTGTTLSPMERAVWAILLAHYLSDDGSNISNLHGQEVKSPWAEGRVVRIVAPPPAKASP